MGDRYSDELGELSYEETLEAVKILLQEKLTPQEEASILLYFIHSFNDKYNRNKIVSVPIEDDNLFKKYIHRILQISDCWKDCDELLLKAELLRESGLFDEALIVLKSISLESYQQKQISARIIEEFVNYKTWKRTHSQKMTLLTQEMTTIIRFYKKDYL